MAQTPVEKEKDFLRRVARAVRAGKPRVVTDVIRVEMRWPGDLHLSADGVLAMRNTKNDIFKVNAFTGETTHPNYLAKLSSQMMLSSDFRNNTKPQLNAGIYAISAGVYKISLYDDEKLIQVDRDVSGEEMLKKFMRDPEAGDPILGVDLDAFTGPDGPAQFITPKSFPSVSRDDISESLAILDKQKAASLEAPDFETWML